MTQLTFRLPPTGSCPSLFVRRHPRLGAPPVLYVHGATFPSALSVGFDFGDGLWLDDWALRGFDAWAFDFAGFGNSDRYPEMSEPADRHPPLGRAPEAARQVVSVLALIRRETGQRVSLVAHSWGSMPAACAAIAEPDAVDRLVLFAPIARRTGGNTAALPAWTDVTNAAEHARFGEHVPKGHPPVLAWSGRLAWNPAQLTRPLAIVRGAWDSLCTHADAAMLLDTATAAPQRHDRRLEAGTHLMHLETGRRVLYEAVGRALKGDES